MKINLTEEHGLHNVTTLIESISPDGKNLAAEVVVDLGQGLRLTLEGPLCKGEEEARRVGAILREIVKTILDRVNLPVRGEYNQIPSRFDPILPQWIGWWLDELRDGKPVIHALTDNGFPWCDPEMNFRYGNSMSRSNGNISTTLGNVTCPVCRLHFGM